MTVAMIMHFAQSSAQSFADCTWLALRDLLPVSLITNDRSVDHHLPDALSPAERLKLAILVCFMVHLLISSLQKLLAVARDTLNQCLVPAAAFPAH